MVAKDPAKRIENITERIKQLEAQKKQLEAREKEKERKARTRRLIQIGAIIESLGINSIELAEKFKTNYEENPKAKEWLKDFLKMNSKVGNNK